MQWLAVVLLAVSASAAAEPYLAVREGLACSACHLNPSGAGLRTAFGNGYARERLPAAGLPAGAPDWNGRLAEHFAFGANARMAARQTELSNRDDSLDFGVDQVTVYAAAELGRATLYLDQQVAPGGSLNREAWARFDLDSWYVKAGRLFLPFGWRLEDDSAFVREATGVSLNQGDDGLELGVERPNFSWQLAATNGNGGGAEVDDGKLFSSRAAWIRGRWRAGLSAYHNDTDQGRRAIGGVFLGARTGSVSWLAEYDYVDDQDDATAGSEQQSAALIEANVLIRKGHNLKLTAEGRFFDDDREDRYRYSAVYEYFPWPFTQFRLGVRVRDSEDEDAANNGDAAFLQAHVFF